MRRLTCLVLLSTTVLLAVPAAGQAPPQPSGQGVNVIPDPQSQRRGADGTFAELGELAPGVPVEDAVVVRSSFDEDREVYLYGADAVPARGGGFGFDARTDPREQVGAWLTTAQQSVVVPARGSVRVTYRVAVPPGTPGGEYVGAVVAEPVEQAGTPGAVQTVTRFAMAVYLRVPGAAEGATPGRGRPDGRFTFEALELQEQSDVVCPVVTYRNESQDILDPAARVTVEGLLGGGRTVEQRGGAVLPDTTATVQLECVRPPIGPGRVRVELSTPRGEGERTTDATRLPWPFVLACLALLLLLLALLALLLRGLRRRRDDDRAPAA